LTTKQAGPVRSPNRPTRRVLCDPHCSDPTHRSQAAFCPWHECGFREAFPARCPYSTPNPLAALTRMQNAGWIELGKGDADPSADRDSALDVLNQADCCRGCLERGLTHPVVRRLRRRAGLGE